MSLNVRDFCVLALMTKRMLQAGSWLLVPLHRPSFALKPSR